MRWCNHQKQVYAVAFEHHRPQSPGLRALQVFSAATRPKGAKISWLSIFSSSVSAWIWLSQDPQCLRDLYGFHSTDGFWTRQPLCGGKNNLKPGVYNFCERWIHSPAVSILLWRALLDAETQRISYMMGSHVCLSSSVLS